MPISRHAFWLTIATAPLCGLRANADTATVRVQGLIDDTVYYPGIFPESGEPAITAGNVVVGDFHSSDFELTLTGSQLSVRSMSGYFDHTGKDFLTEYGFTNPEVQNLEIVTFGASREIALPYSRFDAVEGIYIRWLGSGETGGVLPANINYYLYMFGEPGSILNNDGFLLASSIAELVHSIDGVILQLDDGRPELRAFDVDSSISIVPGPETWLLLGAPVLTRRRRR